MIAFVLGTAITVLIILGVSYLLVKYNINQKK